MLNADIKSKKTWSDKGVSEVIGTILMLAITVVLFSTIMVTVTNMPAPQQRPNADFVATLTLQTGNQAYLNVTHSGGETLYSYSARVIVVRDYSNSVLYTLEDGAMSTDWSIGGTWSKQLGDVSLSTRVEVRIVDLDTNSMIWSSVVTGGQKSLYPEILQRWVDADNSTLTLDPIRVSDTRGFTFYVRVADADYDLDNDGVWIDASSVGGSSHKDYMRITGGVWEFDFQNISDASTYDGKPLFIHALDDAGHETIDSYVFSVLQPDVVVNQGDTYITPVPPLGEEGLPAYLIYVHGDQGYVVLGENKSGNETHPRVWGRLANLSDPKFTFVQGEEWAFIRVGTKNLKNVDGKNTMEIRGIYSNQLVSPPSNNSAFTIYTVSGPAYIYQAKFNTSLLAPGAYSVFIDLLSAAVEGTSPSRFQSNFVLTISAPAGQKNITLPTLKFYKEDRRVNTSAAEWGTKTHPFDLSSVGTSTAWVEIGMQTLGAATTASIKDVRLSDMRARTNLNGDPPSGNGMLSSIGADASNKAYYFAIDLRLRNGVTYSSGLSAYNFNIGQVSDADEGIYTLSTPLWIKSAAVSRNFVVGTEGFGVGNNFAHVDYLFSVDNNKFFTTRVLDAAEESPSDNGMINVYLTDYFDMDEDGDRDVLAAMDWSGNNYLAIYINRMNEYGMWEPRSIFTNYSTTGESILSMAHGDVDNDGDQDWIVSTSAGKVHLYLNDYPVRTMTIFTTGSLRYFKEMRLVDITGDSRADLVAIGYSSSVARGDLACRLYLYNLTRGSSVTTTPIDLGNYPATNRNLYDFDMGDIDGDGDMDIAVTAGYGHGGYGVRWYERTETEASPGALAAGDPVSYTGLRVSGTYVDTQEYPSANSYESLQEVSGDLDYAWPVSSVSGERAKLYFEARVNSGADENFYVYYGKSTVGPWIFMFVVPMTATVDETYSFQLPAGTTGTVYIRIEDGSTAGISDDTIYIDRINIRGLTAVSYTTLHGLDAATTYIAIGIGNMDGYGKLDVAVAKGAGGVGGEIKVLNCTSGTALTTIAYASLTPTGNTFQVRDTNGDGRADIVSVSYVTEDNSALRLWLNMGSGTSFTNILIKDFRASYGNAGGGVSAANNYLTINCICVENPYGD